MKTDGLKVGDRVFRVTYQTWGSNQYTIATVSRVLPSGRVELSVNSWKGIFNPDGKERGRGWRGDWIEPFDQTVLDRQKHEKLVLTKRRFLENHELWRNKLNENLILYIAELVEAELAK